MDALFHREAQKVAHCCDTVRLNFEKISPFVVSADDLLAPQAQEVLNTFARSLPAEIQG